MKRRSLRVWLSDTLRTCGLWTPVILTGSVVVGMLSLFLLDGPNTTATTEVGFAPETETTMDAETAQSIIDHVQEPAFDTQINEALQRSGKSEDATVSASYETEASVVKLHGSAAEDEVADQTSLFAADAVIAWSGSDDNPESAELTILEVSPAEPSSPVWPAALTLALAIGAFSLVLVVAARKPQRQLRFSRDLAPAHRGVPVIVGTETTQGDALRKVTAVLSRVGRPEDGSTTIVAVIGLDEPVPARLIDVLERRLAAADSAVRLQAVRGVSQNIARFSAVLLSCPAVIGADRVSETLDLIDSHRAQTAAVLLGDIDTIEAHSERPDPTARTNKTPNVEVIIADPCD